MNRQVAYGFSILGFAACLCSIPLHNRLDTYLTAEMFVGLFAAAIDVASNAWMLEMWQEGTNSLMQAMYLMFAIGQALGPVIVEPYLSDDRKNDDKKSEIDINMQNVTAISLQEQHLNTSTRIIVPFAVSCIIMSGGMIAVFLLRTFMAYQSPGKEPIDDVSEGDESPNKERNIVIASIKQASISRCRFLLLVLLGSLFFAFHSGVRYNTLTFIPKFAKMSQLQLSKSTASYMVSVFTGSYAVARAFSILIAAKVPVRDMLFVNLMLIGAGNVLLAIFSNTWELMIWLSLVILGVGHSSVIPGIYAFMEEKVRVTNFVCGSFSFFSTTASVFTTILLGNLIESNPFVFLYINLFSLSSCIAIFAILRFII